MILIDLRVERRVHADFREMCNQLCEPCSGLQAIDARQLCGKGLQTESIDAARIHETGIQVSNLPPFGARGGLSGLFNDAPESVLDLVEQLIGRTVARLVGWNLRRGEPLSVHVLV